MELEHISQVTLFTVLEFQNKNKQAQILCGLIDVKAIHELA